MAQPTLNINPVSFDLIRRGEKTLEFRLWTEELKHLRVGDTLVIRNRESGETISRKILELRNYPSLQALLDGEKFQKSGPFNTRQEVVERMRQFQTEEEEQRCGLVAIHLAPPDGTTSGGT